MSNDFAKRRKKAEEPKADSVEAGATSAEATPSNEEPKTSWQAAPETLPKAEPQKPKVETQQAQSMEMPSSDDFAAMLAGEVIERPFTSAL